MEGADVGRLLLRRPDGDPALEELGDAAGVAHDGDPLPLCGQSPGLLQRQPGLARSCPAADLHAPVALEHVEDPRLVTGQQIALCFAFKQPGDEVLLRDTDAMQALDEPFDVVRRRSGDVLLELAECRGDPAGGLRQVLPVEHHPARRVRRGEVGRQRRRRQRDQVGHPGVADAPAGVFAQVLAQQVLAYLGLVDRADALVDAAAVLPPLAVTERDTAALHLDDGDA